MLFSGTSLYSPEQRNAHAGFCLFAMHLVVINMTAIGFKLAFNMFLLKKKTKKCFHNYVLKCMGVGKVSNI